MKKIKMLKKNYEFRSVLSKGKYQSGEYLEAFITKNYTTYNLLGIGISTKCGKAVKRNRIKRYIRESIYKFENTLKSGNSIVILWKKKKNIEEVNFKEIHKDIFDIFEKAGILESRNENDEKTMC